MNFHRTLSVSALLFLGLLFGSFWLLSAASVWAADMTLRVMVQDSRPKYFVLKEGEAKLARIGLCGEIYAQLKQRLSSKGVVVDIPPFSTPIKRIMQMVDSGRADAFCGAGRNAQREKRFIYSSRPVYQVSNVVMTHKDNLENPKTFDDLMKTKLTVGALFGTSSARYLKSRIGDKVMDQIYSLDNALQVVAEKRMGYFFYHDLGLYYLTGNSDLPLRVVPTKFRTTPQWMIYSKKTSSELRSLVEAEIASMEKEGLLKEISEKYMPTGS